MSGPRRTAPFPGWARGVPIVGQRAPELPPGRHFYQVAILVRREGLPLDAESMEIQLSKPLDGFDYKLLPQKIVESLRAKAPDLPEPRVVIVSVWDLGFIPQEAIDRALEEAKASGSAGGNGGLAS